MDDKGNGEQGMVGETLPPVVVVAPPDPQQDPSECHECGCVLPAKNAKKAKKRYRILPWQVELCCLACGHVPPDVDSNHGRAEWAVDMRMQGAIKPLADEHAATQASTSAVPKQASDDARADLYIVHHAMEPPANSVDDVQSALAKTTLRLAAINTLNAQAESLLQNIEKHCSTLSAACDELDQATADLEESRGSIYAAILAMDPAELAVVEAADNLDAATTAINEQCTESVAVVDNVDKCVMESTDAQEELQNTTAAATNAKDELQQATAKAKASVWARAVKTVKDKFTPSKPEMVIKVFARCRRNDTRSAIHGE